MGDALHAIDLWPLVLKLSPEERRRLAQLAWDSAFPLPSTPDVSARCSPRLEDSSSDDPLAWEAGGWDEFSARP